MRRICACTLVVLAYTVMVSTQECPNFIRSTSGGRRLLEHFGYTVILDTSLTISAEPVFSQLIAAPWYCYQLGVCAQVNGGASAVMIWLNEEFDMSKAYYEYQGSMEPVYFWFAGISGSPDGYTPLQPNTAFYWLDPIVGMGTLPYDNGMNQPARGTALPYLIDHCGDGMVECGCLDNETTYYEGCDDGNTETGDGCSATCTIETGYECSGAPSVCVRTGGTPLGLVLWVSIPCGLLVLLLWTGNAANFNRDVVQIERSRHGWIPLSATKKEGLTLLHPSAGETLDL
jgi:cysteine-rich repeat protein